MGNKVFPALIAGSVLALAGAPTAQAQSCQDLRDLGDDLRIALPLTAFGLTWLKGDADGAFQYARQLAATGVGTGLFKAVGDKTRPDARTSRESFVSGHVSSVMSGASFIYTRYGKWLGVPAYGLAGVTAYSRVCAQKHFDDDVLGGTMVALMSNWYFTSPHPETTQITPSFTSNGVEISWRTMFDGNRVPADPQSFEARYRAVFEFGPVVQDKNIIRAPNDGGTEINLADLETEFHMTARLWYERYFTDKHEMTMWYGPLGMTDFGEPTEPFRVGDVVFDPADADAEIFDSNYRWWDLRFGYRYNLVNNERWRASLGVGVQYSRTDFEVEQRDASEAITKRAAVFEERVHPTVHASVAYHFNHKWSIETDIDGMTDGSEYYWNNGIFVRYRASQLWDFGFGSRGFWGKLDSAGFYNEIEFFDLAFQVGRSF